VRRPRHFLGFHAYLYDAAAALVRDGEVIAAVAEERLDRNKHSGAFPERAIRSCLAAGGVEAEALDGIGFTFRPWKQMHRRALAIAGGLPRSLAFGASHGGVWWQMLNAGREFRRRIGGAKVPFRHHLHHRCHAAMAHDLSPFDRAAVLVMDGSGEAAATTIFHAGPWGLKPVSTLWYPHSLGYLYQAATHYLGFQPACDEGKVMGLAAYGDPRALPRLAELVRPTRRGYRLELGWFDFHQNGATPENGRLYVSEAFVRAFGPPRRPGAPLEDRHADVAAGVQAALERAVLHLADLACRLTGERRLAVAGGVALNSVANGLLLESRPDLEFFAAPACGDDGAAIGAALLSHHDRPGRPRVPLATPFLGPGPDADAIAAAVRDSDLPFGQVDDPAAAAAEAIAAGQVVGWFQGRSEIGPRALGHRSILADPRDPAMKDRLNARVKHRESFRPFAPAIPRERYADWFEGRPDRPYMLEVARVRSDRRAALPAITHVDGTARVQTVTDASDPLFWRLLHHFEKLTGVPVVINTSFNVMGEPLVQTPAEAIACYRGTGIDVLVLGDFVCVKEAG
jgi:carbamoyltransferase